ncbi:MAG: galactose mutarotase [Saprospiraceae bacterium]|nr:galactose mutarotase [Saprospiraceae bacterium]
MYLLTNPFRTCSTAFEAMYFLCFASGRQQKVERLSGKVVLLLFLSMGVSFATSRATSLPVNSRDDPLRKDLQIRTVIYGTTSGGQQVMAYALSNGVVSIELLEYGAIVSSVRMPDRMGNVADIVLGYDHLQDWENDPYYFGATVGRVANRTGSASFTLNGDTYELAPNTLPDFGRNHLHGGEIPFNKVVWNGTPFSNEEEVGVAMEYLSKHMEEGYPGNLTCKVIFSLNIKNELKIQYEAKTDQTTLVNMTHHSYFNLYGAGKGTIHDHQIRINATQYTEADADLIPTGKILPVKGQPIDFITMTTVGPKIPLMLQEKFIGFDHNYVLPHESTASLVLAAQALDPKSGRMLTVHTTQPCMHFYTSNFLEGKVGRHGEKYQQYGAFCFEPQGYPDAANKPIFQSIVLRPEEEYEQTLIYSFSIQQ